MDVDVDGDVDNSDVAVFEWPQTRNADNADCTLDLKKRRKSLRNTMALKSIFSYLKSYLKVKLKLLKKLKKLKLKLLKRCLWWTKEEFFVWIEVEVEMMMMMMMMMMMVLVLKLKLKLKLP